VAVSRSLVASLAAALSLGTLVGVMLERLTDRDAATVVGGAVAAPTVASIQTAASSATPTAALPQAPSATQVSTETSRFAETPVDTATTPVGVDPQAEPPATPVRPEPGPRPTQPSTPTIEVVRSLFSEAEVVAAARTRYGTCIDEAARRETLGPSVPVTLGADFEPAAGRWSVVSLYLAPGTGRQRWFSVYFIEATAQWVPIRVPEGCPR
jgi:hypothetical protein